MLDEEVLLAIGVAEVGVELEDVDGVALEPREALLQTSADSAGYVLEVVGG